MSVGNIGIFVPVSWNDLMAKRDENKDVQASIDVLFLSQLEDSFLLPLTPSLCRAMKQVLTALFQSRFSPHVPSISIINSGIVVRGMPPTASPFTSQF